MKKIIILATDTPHRRYFIKKLVMEGVRIDAVFFETSNIIPRFPTGPFFEKEERNFESLSFFNSFDDSLNDIKAFYLPNINDLEVKTYIEENNIDFGIVFGTRKVSSTIVDAFRDGAINVHRGIAEEYRGLDTNLWAIYHSDVENAGVTVHFVGKELDTGDIVLQERVIYPPKTQIFQLRYFETLLATDLVIRSAQNYLAGKLVYRPQIKKGRYYSFMPLVIKELLPEKLEKALGK